LRRRRNLDPSPLREILPGVLKEIERHRKGPVEKVRAIWPEVVGPVAAGRTRIIALEGGTVRVDVASSGLRHDLATFRREEVLRELRKALPELAILEVRYRLAALP
jgi:hypothetical protein